MPGLIRLCHNTKFGRLLNHLGGELARGRKIEEGLLEFAANRLTDEEPDQGFTTTSVELDCQITLNTSLVPRTKGGCLRVPQVVYVLRLGKGLEDLDGIPNGIADGESAQLLKVNHWGIITSTEPA